MDEAAIIFFEDVAEKTIINRSAYSRAKRTKLPLNHYTDKEIEKMHGNVKSYDLSKPMSWAAFTSMSDDLKKEYVHNLYAHGATTGFMTELFGVSHATLRKLLNRLGFKAANSKPSILRKQKWSEWLAQCKNEETKNKEPENDIQEAPPVIEEAKPSPVKHDETRNSANGCVTITGRLSEICEFLSGTLGDAPRTFFISFGPCKSGKDQ